MLENHYHLERLDLEMEGILRLEVVSTDPVRYPISAFFLPNEEKYVTDSYVITVKVKDGMFQYLFFLFMIHLYEILQWYSPAQFVVKHSIICWKNMPEMCYTVNCYYLKVQTDFTWPRFGCELGAFTGFTGRIKIYLNC